VQQVADRHAAVMEALESATLRERAADIRQVGRMVVEHLSGGRREPPPGSTIVLVDDEVTAPDLLENADHVAGAVSARGGASSHAAIVARSLGVPFVIDAPGPAVAVPDGTLLLVDADNGKLVVSPDGRMQAAVSRALTASQPVQVGPHGALTTSDGVPIALLANIASEVEARRAVAAGADGVGLLRTELAFLDAPDWPTSVAHETQLRPMLRQLAGLQVTVRVLDFTNDKHPPFLAGRPSGLDMLLDHPWAFDHQLRALLSAGADVDLRIMLPMVVDPEQVQSVRRRLGALTTAGANVMLGSMVESPAAVERASELARVSDFLSIGTNDLTAGVLGMARTDTRLSTTMAAQPAVLRCISETVRAADESGVPVSVCGDAAADQVVLPLLVGAGLRSFSVGVARLGEVRTLISALDVEECGQLFAQTSAVRVSHAS
jgi:phosphoenolpyruvate-protein kinase (PTS system EI component)